MLTKNSVNSSILNLENGDYCHLITKSNNNNYIFIFCNNPQSPESLSCYACIGYEGNYETNLLDFSQKESFLLVEIDNIAKIRPASKEEIALLDDELRLREKYFNKKACKIKELVEVGYFVQHPILGIGEVIDVNEDGFKVEFQSVGTLVPTIFEDLEPDNRFSRWQPKTGDLCIFWSYNKQYAIIRELKVSNSQYYVDNIGTIWLSCVPFISPFQYKKIIASN